MIQFNLLASTAANRRNRVLSWVVALVIVAGFSAGCSSTSPVPSSSVKVVTQTPAVASATGGIPDLSGVELKIAVYKWFLRVSPSYQSLEHDLEALNSAVNNSDDGAVNEVSLQLKHDTKKLAAFPSSPDSQAQISVEQAVKFVRLGADECLRSQYIQGLQDLENGGQWVVAIRDRVFKVENGTS